MSIDLTNLSLQELKALHKQVGREIDGYAERKKREAMAELENVARSHGFSLDELTGAKTSRKRAPAQAKFANPEDGSQTWTGRGRKPRWVEAALKSGKSMGDLAI